MFLVAFSFFTFALFTLLRSTYLYRFSLCQFLWVLFWYLCVGPFVFSPWWYSWFSYVYSQAWFFLFWYTNLHFCGFSCFFDNSSAFGMSAFLMLYFLNLIDFSQDVARILWMVLQIAFWFPFLLNRCYSLSNNYFIHLLNLYYC